MMKIRLAILMLTLAAAVGPEALEAMSKRPSEVGNATITDRTGETWDLSQAVTEGFEPEKFQYGLGRHAFTTLDESRITEQPEGVPDNLRVIGKKIGGEAVAASVPLLTRHEVANITLGETPIAVAY